MIIDICFYNNEEDVLDIRLNQHNKYVSKFIIIYSDRTFSGELKSFNKKKFYKKFKKFKKKIILEKVDLIKSPKNRWENEIKTINHVNKIKIKFDKKNIILISDVDEIIKEKTFLSIKKIKNFPQTLQVENYYYFLNGKIISGYANDFGPLLIKKNNLKLKISELRKERPNLPKIQNAAWHFSYLGGAKKISKKIKEFSHSEYDNRFYNDENKIKQKINNGLDLFQRKKGHSHFKGDIRSFKIYFEKLDKSYPSYVLKNKKKFSRLIKKNTNNKFDLKEYYFENENYIFNLKSALNEERRKNIYLFNELKRLKIILNKIHRNFFYIIYKKINFFIK